MPAQLNKPLHPASYRPLLAWLLLMAVAIVILAWQFHRGIQFDTSILSLLPDEHNSAAESFANNRIASNASQGLILLVSGERASSLVAAEQLQTALQDSGLFARVEGKTDATQLSQLLDQLSDWRYYHLTAVDRAKLQQAHQVQESSLLQEPSPLVSAAISRLYSPLGATLTRHLVDDPLQLLDHWREQALPNQGISLQDDWPTRIEPTPMGQHWHRIVLAELNGSPFDMGYQRQLSELLQRLNNTIHGLSYTGLIVHATYGANQAQHEISTIGVVSLLGIVLLMLLVFRRPSYLLLVFMPLLFGCLLAMATCLLIFDRVHLITLAFGASLVGVAIDYSLHFLCHRLEQPIPTTGTAATRDPVTGAITLGMLSSVLAYLAQAAAPFPGLQQMAVFSAAGLVGAWLTVMGLLPWLTRRMPANPDLSWLLHRLAAIRSHWPRIHQPGVAILLTLLALLALWQLPKLAFDDSLIRLQTSPVSLLQNDQRINQLAGGASWARYLLLSGDSAEQLLQHSDTLRDPLEQLLSRNPGLHYHSVSQQLASQQQQRADYQQQATTVYASGGLLEQFAKQLGAVEISRSARADFANRANLTITPEHWLASAFSASSRHLWLGEFGGRFYAVVNFSGTVPANLVEQLQPLLQDAHRSDWLQLVDRPAAIGKVLNHYRHNMGWWLAAAYAAVLLLLALRYRLTAWRILAGPALASVLTLNLLALLGMQLTLFNLLALLLVLGIGMDAGIFLRNSRNSLYTWLAVAMSALTTLLAFGLLALSQTPVLMYFGATVLCGVILVWLLTPVFTLEDQHA